MMSGELSNYRFVQAEAFSVFLVLQKQLYAPDVRDITLRDVKLRKNDDRIMTVQNVSLQKRL